MEKGKVRNLMHLFEKRDRFKNQALIKEKKETPNFCQQKLQMNKTAKIRHGKVLKNFSCEF